MPFSERSSPPLSRLWLHGAGAGPFTIDRPSSAFPAAMVCYRNFNINVCFNLASTVALIAAFRTEFAAVGATAGLCELKEDM